MADKKVSDLVNEQTKSVPEDLIYTVDDVSGTPAQKKLGFGTFLKTYNKLTEESAAGLSNDDLDFEHDHGDIRRVGATESAADVSAAIASTVSVVDGTDRPLIMRGDYTITSGVTLKDHHVEATHATLNCDTVSGVSVTVEKSSSAFIRDRRIELPRILRNKPGTGWTAGTVGLHLVNLARNIVATQRIEGFETGKKCECKAGGIGFAWNNFHIGHFDNNKVQLLLTQDGSAGGTVFLNSNTWWGASFGHNTAEGTEVSGVLHLKIDGNFANVMNDNNFNGCKFEDATAEFMIHSFGTLSNFDDCRFDGIGGDVRIKWDATAAVGNGVEGSHNKLGYGTYFPVASVFTQDDQCRGNLNNTRNRFMFDGSGSIECRNASSDSLNAFAVGDVTTRILDADLATKYRWGITAETLQGKRKDDADNRAELSGQNSELRLGDGTNPPDTILGRGAANRFETADEFGADVLNITDGVTAPGALSGKARLYVDTADGDLKVVFADGAVRTVRIDLANQSYTRNATIVEDRTLLASASATTLNNNNVLAALIADLIAAGIIS